LGISVFQTGTLTVKRQLFESFLLENGGTVAKSVTKSVTHLVSGETDSKKCADATAKGVIIVNEQWVRDKVSSVSSQSGTAASAKIPSIKKEAITEEVIVVKAEPPPAPAPVPVPVPAPHPSTWDEIVEWEMEWYWRKAQEKEAAALEKKASEKTKTAEAVVAGKTKKRQAQTTTAIVTEVIPKAKKSKKVDASLGSRSLAGMTICVTGKLSQPRVAFESMLKEHGATIVRTVTKSCTHLVSANTDTKKCQEAEAKGVQVVDEDWIRAKIEG
jgi:NAD-dependent DNA ligase